MKSNINEIRFTGFVDSDITHEANHIEFKVTQHPHALTYSHMFTETDQNILTIDVRIICPDISYYRLIKPSDRIIVEGKLSYNEILNRFYIHATLVQLCSSFESRVFSSKEYSLINQKIAQNNSDYLLN